MTCLPGGCHGPENSVNNDLEAIVAEYRAQRMVVMVDYHQLGFGATASAADIAAAVEFWTDIANRFKDNPYVWFNLFNEPEAGDGAAQRWRAQHQPVIDAIRATGATNIIVIDDTQAGQGAADWWSIGESPEADSGVLSEGPNLVDPVGRLAFDVHPYDVWGFPNDDDPTCATRYTDEQRDARFASYVQRVYDRGFPLLAGEFGFRAGDRPTSGVSYHGDLSGNHPPCGSTNLLAAETAYRVAPSFDLGMILWHGFDLTTTGPRPGTSWAAPANLTQLGQLQWDYAGTRPAGRRNRRAASDGAPDDRAPDDRAAHDHRRPRCRRRRPSRRPPSRPRPPRQPPPRRRPRPRCRRPRRRRPRRRPLRLRRARPPADHGRARGARRSARGDAACRVGRGRSRRAHPWRHGTEPAPAQPGGRGSRPHRRRQQAAALIVVIAPSVDPANLAAHYRDVAVPVLHLGAAGWGGGLLGRGDALAGNRVSWRPGQSGGRRLACAPRHLPGPLRRRRPVGCRPRHARSRHNPLLSAGRGRGVAGPRRWRSSPTPSPRCWPTAPAPGQAGGAGHRDKHGRARSASADCGDCGGHWRG